MLRVGSRLPSVGLQEYIAPEGDVCAVGPHMLDATRCMLGKTIVVFALPGAFTPTCSIHHLPGYIRLAAEFKAVGVDEIWCLSVNDAFVMAAWGKDQKATGVVRMLADGNAEFAHAAGLAMDLTARGLGVRSQRYSLLAIDGLVKVLNVEAPGKFDVSGASTLLTQVNELRHLAPTKGLD